MTADHDPVIYLDDILDAATKAMQFVADKLIHGYHGIDLRVVWRTVHSDLPAVIEKVRELRAQLGDA